jgi:hypothetical protein
MTLRPLFRSWPIMLSIRSRSVAPCQRTTLSTSRAGSPREIARMYYGAIRMRLLGYVKRKRSALCAKWPARPSDSAGCDTVTTEERWMTTGECGSLPADELIAVLLDQRQHWIYRAWSARLLDSNNEKAITEALFHATQRDPVYWVRRDALRSLQLPIGDTGVRNLAGIVP